MALGQGDKEGKEKEAPWHNRQHEKGCFPSSVHYPASSSVLMETEAALPTAKK